MFFSFFKKKKKSKSKNTKRKYTAYEDIRPNNNVYIKKNSLLSKAEKAVFSSILDAVSGTNLLVYPQINLATVINKMNGFYQNELYRNIDFGIFDRTTLEPLLMIELNDKTHAQRKRAIRDKKVKNILASCNLPLLTIYSNMPNRPEYLRQRIFENLNCK
ncbi:MAG: DUF2726 domain-containing protein [Clostridia bacterium]